MDLEKLIKEVNQRGIELVWLDDYDEPGRLIEVRGQEFIFLNSSLSDIESCNVILHELSHSDREHLNNPLSQVPTYGHRIEHEAETDRIRDFLSLVNVEYPIDENFNYLDYMEKALIPSRYEHLVKETALKLYQENIENKRI